MAKKKSKKKTARTHSATKAKVEHIKSSDVFETAVIEEKYQEIQTVCMCAEEQAQETQADNLDLQAPELIQETACVTVACETKAEESCSDKEDPACEIETECTNEEIACECLCESTSEEACSCEAEAQATQSPCDSQSKPLSVLFAASEAVPFVKTGGLADVAGSLPWALKKQGVNAKLIIPKYGSIAQEYKDAMEHVADFYVPLGWRNVYCGIEKLVHNGVECYFVDNEAYFKREGLYGHFDDGERFAFFAKAICEAIMYIPELQVDVLECNDWQTSLACVFLREFYQHSSACSQVKTVFTIHNVKFQGQFAPVVLSDILALDLNPAAARQLCKPDGSVNYMLGALNYADYISTVSPTYAKELQTPFFGEGLDDVLRRKSSILRGILNGIDTDSWNPVKDPFIETTYSTIRLRNKAENKRKLQQELGLEVIEDKPLIAMIGRLTDQKGIGLVSYAMHKLMERGVQLAILGTGDKEHEDACRYFASIYPGQVAACITFDNALSHRMYAGADLFLMPSEFEPCGLSQMIAMRYGALPVVRETGGLADSVIPYNEYTGDGTGFSFRNINADEMYDCVMRACEVFWTNKDAWCKLQKQAMSFDFSWTHAAKAYEEMFAFVGQK